VNVISLFHGTVAGEAHSPPSLHQESIYDLNPNEMLSVTTIENEDEARIRVRSYFLASPLHHTTTIVCVRSCCLLTALLLSSSQSDIAGHDFIIIDIR
jgi:hypothetical protein